MGVDSRKRHARLRRHLRWAAPLIGGALGYFGFAFALAALPSQNTELDVVTPLLSLLLMTLALLSPLVAFVFFVVGALRTLSEWLTARRFAAGRFTPAEQAERDRALEFSTAWQRAGRLRNALARRELPARVHVWDVVANPGEVFFSDGVVNYARFYGQDVTYTRTEGFYFGRPLFVVAGMALSAAGNAARRSQAEALAREQWREYQSARLLVSNQRLLCGMAGRWLSFPYSTMTAVYPEIGEWMLVCQFETSPPLLLQGSSVPEAALITVLMTHGPEAVEQHPSLAVLAGRS